MQNLCFDESSRIRLEIVRPKLHVVNIGAALLLRYNALADFHAMRCKLWKLF
jgi:hypothetical protein